MTIDDLLNIAEEQHLSLGVAFQPGDEEGKPRGYVVRVAAFESAPRLRVGDAVRDAVGLLMAAATVPTTKKGRA
jgi:hypothetical protein